MGKNKKKTMNKWHENHPWFKHYENARARCVYKTGKYFGRYSFDMTSEEVKRLWFRDNANKLKQPSIDRINNDIGYFYDNCRFIEKSLNNKLGGKVGGRLSKGEKNNTTKLKEKDVLWIREHYKKLSNKLMALMFNVDPRTISAIVVGRNWKYLLENK